MPISDRMMTPRCGFTNAALRVDHHRPTCCAVRVRVRLDLASVRRFDAQHCLATGGGQRDLPGERKQALQ